MGNEGREEVDKDKNISFERFERKQNSIFFIFARKSEVNLFLYNQFFNTILIIRSLDYPSFRLSQGLK